MKALTLITVGAIALAAAGTAAAQAARAPATPAFKPFYVGGGAGWSNFDLRTEDFPDPGSVQFTALPGVPVSGSKDEDDTGWKAFVGWRYNQYLGLEAGYTDLGKAKVQYTAAGAVANVTYKDHAWTLAGVGTFPVGQGFTLIGKLGVAFHNTETTVSGGVTTPGGAFPLSDGATDNRAGFLWGIGAGYDFNPNFGLRLEYENLGTAGESANTGRSGTSLVSGSAIVRF